MWSEKSVVELLHEATIYEMTSIKAMLQEILHKKTILGRGLGTDSNLNVEGFHALSLSIATAFEHESETGLKLFLVQKLADSICKPGIRRVGGYHGHFSEVPHIPRFDWFQMMTAQKCFAVMPRVWVMYAFGLMLKNAQGKEKMITY